jgi:oxygen-independent coproporphyrinogen-3 oxidase
MAADGLVALDAHRIRVLAPGMLLLRNICMCFDRYLRQGETGQRFSRAI